MCEEPLHCQYVISTDSSGFSKMVLNDSYEYHDRVQKYHCVGLDLPPFYFSFARYPVVKIQDRKAQPSTHLLLLNRQEEDDEVRGCCCEVEDSPTRLHAKIFCIGISISRGTLAKALASGKLARLHPAIKQRPTGMITYIQPSSWTPGFALYYTLPF